MALRQQEPILPYMRYQTLAVFANCVFNVAAAPKCFHELVFSTLPWFTFQNRAFTQLIRQIDRRKPARI